MKDVVLVSILLSLIGCSPPCASEIAEETLWVANEQGFAYCDVMQSANGGDADAFWTFIDFCRHTDAAASLGHSVAVKRVAVEAGDDRLVKWIESASTDQTRMLARLLDVGFAYDGDQEFSIALPKTRSALISWLSINTDS